MKTVTIQQQVLFNGSPREIYDAYLDSKRHASFTGAKAKVARRIGGRMTAWDGYLSGQFLILKPNRQIVQTWRTITWPKSELDSLLDIRLEARGKKTRLTMIHSGVPTSLAKGFRTGWHTSYWKPLAAYLKRAKKR